MGDVIRGDLRFKLTLGQHAICKEVKEDELDGDHRFLGQTQHKVYSTCKCED